MLVSFKKEKKQDDRRRLVSTSFQSIGAITEKALFLIREELRRKERRRGKEAEGKGFFGGSNRWLSKKKRRSIYFL